MAAAAARKHKSSVDGQLNGEKGETLYAYAYHTEGFACKVAIERNAFKVVPVQAIENTITKHYNLGV